MTAGDAAPSGPSFADRAFAVSADAYAAEPENWERGIQAAIAGLFAFLAAHPAQTNACIVADCGAGPAALAHSDRVVDRFAELLQPGFAVAAVPPPAVVAEAIGGGIYELVRNHVLERRLDELPGAVEHATVVALSPFVRQGAPEPEGPGAATPVARSHRATP